MQIVVGHMKYVQLTNNDKLHITQDTKFNRLDWQRSKSLTVSCTDKNVERYPQVDESIN